MRPFYALTGAALSVVLLAGCTAASADTTGAAPTPTLAPTVLAAQGENAETPEPVPSATPSPVPTTGAKPFKKKKVDVTVEPGPGRTVGVGYPIIVRFSKPVKDKAAAQAGLSVSVNKPTSVGSWAWMSDDTVYYRTKDFWPGNAKITVSIDLDGVTLGKKGKVRFVGAPDQERKVTFKTGKSVISYVNADSKRMRVTVNGETVRTFPVSLGKPGWETRSGIKVVHEKYEAKRMTSQALGLTNETYDLIAPYSVRITPTGEFVHGAPWANSRMGRYNGSHGCTNMYSQDAKWFFYNAARPGDVVITKGTNKKMETWNGLGGPWNYTWKQWLKKSAIPGSQSSPGVSPEPVTTPVPTPTPVTPAPVSASPAASAGSSTPSATPSQ